MMRLAECSERDIDLITRALRKTALGRPVEFVFEAGMHKGEDGDETPNGTMTFTLKVGGGAQDTGVSSPKLWMP